MDKRQITTPILITILLISLFVRLYNLDYPLSYIFAWGDGARDYFVADHIVKYKEFPLLGPFNLLNEVGIYNSPVYYYLLALFLVPYNHVLTLGVVNIIFQMLTIFLIYLIAKKLFDQKTAILSILIFSFNPEILAQSDYMWQPHISQLVSYLAFFLAILFYFNKRYIFLFFSSLTLAFAFALHNSTFPWIPVFFVFFYRHFLKIILPFSLFMVLLYLPVGRYLMQNDYITVPFSLFSQNISQYLSNFFINLDGILKTFNINNLWVVPILCFSLFYFLKAKDIRKTKISVLLLLVLFFTPLFFASFFNKFRLHYLTLSLGVLTIFLAKIFTCLPAGRPFSKYKLVTFVFAFLLLLSTTNNFQFLKFQKTPLENQKFVDNLSQIILQEIKDPTSFQIKSYVVEKTIFEYPVLDTILLIPLEDKLNIKLAKISDKSPFNHIQTGGKQYFVIVCHEFSGLSRWQECLETFKRSYPAYAILKNLYMGINIALYLSKHD